MGGERRGGVGRGGKGGRREEKEKGRERNGKKRKKDYHIYVLMVYQKQSGKAVKIFLPFLTT